MSHCPIAPCRTAHHKIESISIFAAWCNAARHDRGNATLLWTQRNSLSLNSFCGVVWLLVQGFLQQVEGEVKMLRGELEKRDSTVHTLSSSLATLTSRLEDVEKSSSVESGRFGEGVCVCTVWSEVYYWVQSILRSSSQSSVTSCLSPRKASPSWWWATVAFGVVHW